MTNAIHRPNEITIDTTLVRHLVDSQFPQWQSLSIRPVKQQGWDNRTFHLGENMLVRIPSDACYASQVEKEQQWLPKLAPLLPLPVPLPLAMGKPGFNYPWQWSINRYLPGEPASTADIKDLCGFAADLANFLTALYHIDSMDGPLAGEHSFYRGGSLSVYDTQMQQALVALKDKINIDAAKKIWEAALETSWQHSPVWIHGDISAGNLLVHDGRLCAVIDFGQLAIGDPACDLAIAWTLFTGESRETFRSKLALDTDTWLRGQAWALWKALIIASDLTTANNAEAKQCWRVIDDLLRSNGVKS